MELYTKTYRTGIILMAAGRSERFGRNKLLEEFAGKPLVCHAMHLMRALSEAPHKLAEGPCAAAEPHVVTCCREVEDLARSLHLPCTVYEGGEQSDTIRIGLSLPEAVSWDGCMFLPGDQPFLQAESVSKLLLAFAENPYEVHRLAYGTRIGSPVLFPAAFFSELRKLKGDTGGSSLIRRQNIPVILCQAGSEKELLDADTAEEFELLLAMAGENQKKKNVRET